MLRGKKNFLTKIMCVVMVCCIMILTSSMPAKAAEGTVPEPSDEEIVSLADFEAVDEMIEQRVDALVEGDKKKYKELSEELEEHGCEDISAREVQQLTGGTETDLFNARGQIRKGASTFSTGKAAAASKEINFSKSITTVTHKGKKYKVMKITASPKKRGRLYRTGSVVKRNSIPVKAASLNLLKVMVYNAPYAGKVVKTISALDGGLSALADFCPTTKIEDIEVAYTWSTEEICSFIYVYDAKRKSYPIAASYNKAKYIVGLSIPYLKVRNGKSYSGLVQKQYSEWHSAKDYGNTKKAIDGFNKGRAYNSWVYRINMSGCNGKTIHNVYLQHPETAMQMGYY